MGEAATTSIIINLKEPAMSTPLAILAVQIKILTYTDMLKFVKIFSEESSVYIGASDTVANGFIKTANILIEETE